MNVLCVRPTRLARVRAGRGVAGGCRPRQTWKGTPVGIAGVAGIARFARFAGIARAGRGNKDGASVSKYHPPVNRLNTTPVSGSDAGSNRLLDELLYRYFLWRKDTISDLLLFAFLNVVFVGVVSAMAQALRFSDVLSLYAIGQILVGQELPEESSITFTEQVFAFAVGVLGLSSFAVVLALVEQAVLEILEANVRQGSPVIETDHVVLLSWGTSNRDLAQTIRIVKEICASQQYSWIKDGQLSIVVLSQGREKLEMESIFEGALPESQRAGCRLVFRKGSPLDPMALDVVSVATARTVIISGDYSARCRESDAQVLRSAILVDETLQSALQRGIRGERAGIPLVVVEMQTREGRDLCSDTCSKFVRPVPTTTINAMRTARLLWHPTASVVSHSLFDHNSTCFIGVCPNPDERFLGMTIKELGQSFAYATPFGFVDRRSEQYDLNPRPDRVLQAHEGIVLLQSAERQAATLCPRPIGTDDRRDGIEPRMWTEDLLLQSVKMTRDLGGNSRRVDSTGWGVTTTDTSSSAFSSRSSSASSSASVSSSGTMDDPFMALTSPLAVLPAAALASCDYGAYADATNVNILFCGWPGISYSMELILALDRKIGMEKANTCGCSEEAMSRNKARILILNQHDPAKIEDVLVSLRRELKYSTVEHAKCDPRNRHDLEQVLPDRELAEFKGALTLVDIDWFRDEASSDEPSADFSLTSASMLKMDALILNCQLNLRHMLRSCSNGGSETGSASQNVIFISEKLSGENRVTKYEDRTRLPLGSSVNSSSFAAKVLAQEAILPGSMKIYNKVDDVCRLHVVDTSLFAEPGERVSYAELQGRAADMQCVLLGYYDEPDGEKDSYVALTLNPQGFDAKQERKVWNDVGFGVNRGRLVIAAGEDLQRIIREL